MNHPEEVGRVAFPTGNQATVVMEPGKQALDLPASTPATERPAVLGQVAPIRPMRRDQLNAVGVEQMRVERVAVVALVADQSVREVGEEAVLEGGVDERRFMRRSAGHVNGDRKT